ncbi:MAG: hypothetical protein M0Q29_09820 [Thiopseudomonas sp.]|nr:hypothetical protein [Thiopseudomonas sp.]
MSKEKRKTGWFTWLLTIAFIIFAIAFCAADKTGVGLVTDHKAKTPEEKNIEKAEAMCSDRGYAWIMAGNFVKRKLLSPSSAKFPSSPDSYGYLGDCRHSVAGTVTAQNALGVMIRNNFTVTMIYLKTEGKWRAEDLNIY